VLLLALQLAVPDTLRIRPIDRPPPAAAVIDRISLGSPQVRIQTGQGTALVWLLRARDTAFVVASIPDSTPYWGDDFVLSIDTGGDGGPTPQHDDFQLYFRRVLDSSVVYRGRNGRWEPPRGDPDWRIGRERSGGGWEVSGRDQTRDWTVLLRLDPAWLKGEAGRLPRIAFRIYDNDRGWFTWPSPIRGHSATEIERTPSAWIPLR
jgi:hypothetical protein